MSQASQPEPEPLYTNPFQFSSGLALTRENLYLVNGFTCGQADQHETLYERDVSEWIQRELGGALAFVEEEKGEVILFLHDDGRLIGYGAISQVVWDFEERADTVWLIHYAGIHTQFRGQAGVPRPERFGRRLLGGLIEEIERRGGCDLMALYVDPNNPARRLYEDFGFSMIDTEVDGDRTWVRMIRRLQPPTSLE